MTRLAGPLHARMTRALNHKNHSYQDKTKLQRLFLCLTKALLHHQPSQSPSEAEGWNQHRKGHVKHWIPTLNSSLHTLPIVSDNCHRTSLQDHRKEPLEILPTLTNTLATVSISLLTGGVFQHAVAQKPVRNTISFTLSGGRAAND